MTAEPQANEQAAEANGNQGSRRRRKLHYVHEGSVMTGLGERQERKTPLSRLAAAPWGGVTKGDRLGMYQSGIWVYLSGFWTG